MLQVEPINVNFKNQEMLALKDHFYLTLIFRIIKLENQFQRIYTIVKQTKPVTSEGYK